ncbi:hypothetical protein JQ554_23510 [Bradyrhizobium diazoefficiens]|jgi:hypothetical protein|nr:hypothetical protein [Bradyrhizobium diazoefficiens]UCF53577.1 MAG: hypothetical protein JSV48_03805 [Bradyrhizobium sp.]MBR0967021.1 hypothetical protein [Bradyrhizobium diazoefficiens]MBR0979145.1 hypothetical protein [Bradyrhizobium diazoefficiens]MBR1010004.1 hypothetical protein [Bradyrhizobium diazoefficiens]MBR1016582.1 hypothetical protein [Bradyrhizobium diazoefficiens]
MMVRSCNPALRRGTLIFAALSLLLDPGGTGWAQSAPPSLGLQEQGPQPAPPPSAPAPPVAEEKPGLINEMGKLFDKLPSILPPIKSPSETMNDLSRLATPSTMVSGRIACPASSNGAPDCKRAADQLCQSKGYKEGKSLNADSAEKCSAKVLIPGRQRKPDDCRTDTFVTSALCQN